MAHCIETTEAAISSSINAKMLLHGLFMPLLLFWRVESCGGGGAVVAVHMMKSGHAL